MSSSTPPTTSFVLKESTRQKLDDLQAHLRANNLKVSDGLIVRALIQQSEPSPEFFGLVRRLYDEEKDSRRSLLAISRKKQSGKKSSSKKG